MSAYFDICYPPSDDMAAATRARLAKAESLKAALKTYKESGELLEKLEEEENSFAELVKQEYLTCVNLSEALLESSCKWTKYFKDFGISARDRKQGKEELKEPWLTKVLEAYNESTDEIVKKVFNDYDAYRVAVRECVQKLSGGYKPRVDKFTPAEELLKKSAGKAHTYMGRVRMPKSLLGEHGVVDALYDVAYVKNQATQAFSAGFNYDGEERQNGTYSDVKIGDITSYRSEINKYLYDTLFPKLDIIKKEELESYRANIIETARQFALKSEENRDFILDEKKGIKRYLRQVLDTEGMNTGEVTSTLNYGLIGRANKLIRDVDYVPYYATLLGKLPLIQELILSEKKYEGGNYDASFEEPLNAFLKASKVKENNPTAQITLVVKNKKMDENVNL